MAVCLPCPVGQAAASGQPRSPTGTFHLLADGQDVAKEAVSPNRGRVLTTREIASRVRQSLVMIVTQDHGGHDLAQGSGFFVSPTLVATNLHVLKRASQGYVKLLSDGSTFKITDVSAFSLKHDICLLHLADAKGVPLVDSREDVEVGDEILVAGNPEGLEATFSKGIISGIRPKSGLLQIDAPISPGSSGGPVVNDRGEVVGLAVSSLVEGQNLNFAVPIRYTTDRTLDNNSAVETVGRISVTDLDNGGFNGPVKTLSESEAHYSPVGRTDQFVLGPVLTTNAMGFDHNGRLVELDFFENGEENGRMLLEYSDAGLMKRRINVDVKGKRTVANLDPVNAVYAQTESIMLDETDENTVGGLRRVYRYDSMGHQVEWSIPDQGMKHVIKYDSKGRETDDLEYHHGELYSVVHSKYENNPYGDWIKRHETWWFAKTPNLGWSPWAECHRDITYYAENGQ
jgi:Trypsin-like peptidase domain